MENDPYGYSCRYSFHVTCRQHSATLKYTWDGSLVYKVFNRIFLSSAIDGTQNFDIFSTVGLSFLMSILLIKLRNSFIRKLESLLSLIPTHTINKRYTVILF